MNHNQKTALSILSSYVNNNILSIDGKLDIEFINEFSEKQDLALIIYQVLKKTDNHYLYRYRNELLKATFIDTNREYLLKEIVYECSQKNIDLICMKGSCFRNYYFPNECRSMGDIDIVIHEKDIQKIDHIMIGLGYNKMIDNHSVWTYWIDQFMFEIHNHMFYEELSNDTDYIAYFDNIWKHVHNEKVFSIESENLYVPDNELHFIYLMTHTAKHILNKGIGFRAFLDMVMLVKNCKIDWKTVKQELININLYDFTITCFAFCEKWFNVEMPFGQKYLDEDFFEKITDKMFMDGLFGLDNLENETGNIAKDIERSTHGFTSTSFALTIRKLFPSYRDMQIIPHYRFINGKRYLLPVAWLYRWIYCIFNKPTHSFKLLLQPLLKREEIKKRQKYINDWGL